MSVTTNPTRSRTGGELLVDCLLANDVPLMTCVPGESFLAILDALYDRSQSPDTAMPRLITTRHEAAAANMAEAAGKLTGRAGVCFVTRGPGATHASIALHTAFQDGTPMILVIGQVPRNVEGRSGFQEMDYRAVFGSTAKSVVDIRDANRIPEHVARAVQLAHSGRPGPVVLVVPEDMLTDSTDAAVLPIPSLALVPPAAAGVESVAERLREAKRPLFVVGGTGWSQEVGQLMKAFAEANGLPMAAAFRWQDAVDNRSSSYVGYLGYGGSPLLRKRLEEADLIVAVGPRLDDPTTDGFSLSAEVLEKIVLVNEDAAELCRTIIPGTGIHSGIKPFVEALSASQQERDAERAEWTAALRSDYEAYSQPPATDSDVDLATVIGQIREALPDDAVVTTGAGNYTTWVQRFFQFRQFATQLAPRNGAMGYGLPAALAAAAVASGPAVAFSGDGGTLMSGSELATAVQHDLDLVFIVVNNGMFGTIRMHQEREYPDRVIATDLRNPDFVAYAQSFGALGILVERTADFPEAFATALAHPGPALIELRTDRQQITPDKRLD